MKFTLKSSKWLDDIMYIKQDFYCKKVFHDLLNFTSQSRRKPNKAKLMWSKWHVIRANLSYRNSSGIYGLWFRISNTINIFWTSNVCSFILLPIASNFNLIESPLAVQWYRFLTFTSSMKLVFDTFLQS